MKIQFFTRLHYESFICMAVDTKKYRYWYNLSKPLFLMWFPQYLVDDNFRTQEEKEKEKELEKSIGFERLSIQGFIEGICHLILHIKFTFKDMYCAEREPLKYENYNKWYTKLFSKKYFYEHQYRIS